MLKLTDRAWREIKIQGQGRWLHVFVSGGGCNGFQYGMDWIEPMPLMSNESWLIQDTMEIAPAVYVGKKSQPYLRDAVLDHDPFKGFFFDNPQAVSSCGCGKSVGF